jgi:hypothetical protein
LNVFNMSRESIAMDLVLVSDVLYLALSVALTALVAHKLSQHGRTYLADVFHGDQRIAGAVNQLLVVGFYLVNLGFAALSINIGGPISTARDVVSGLSVKLGTELLVVGALHLINLWVFGRIRRNALLASQFAEATRRPATSASPN